MALPVSVLGAAEDDDDDDAPAAMLLLVVEVVVVAATRWAVRCVRRNCCEEGAVVAVEIRASGLARAKAARPKVRMLQPQPSPVSRDGWVRSG